MFQIAEFSFNEVLPFIPDAPQRDKVKESFAGYDVKVSSDRLILFKRNNKCVCCGIAGNKFVLETHALNQNPHFNLYACVDGDMILMTKDHIIAASKGGNNTLSNYQTMCQICNQIKDDYNINLEELKKVRKSYDSNVKAGMPRKTAWKRALNLKDDL